MKKTKMVIVVTILFLTAINYIFIVKSRRLIGEEVQISAIGYEILINQKELEALADGRYILDMQYKNEMLNSGGVTSQMIEILIKYAGLWKQEMERYYNLLYDTLDDAGKSSLENSQKAWEEYSVKNNELIFYMEEQKFEGGSYLGVLDAELLYQKYRSRASELKEMYGKLLTEG